MPKTIPLTTRLTQDQLTQVIQALQTQGHEVTSKSQLLKTALGAYVAQVDPTILTTMPTQSAQDVTHRILNQAKDPWAGNTSISPSLNQPTVKQMNIDHILITLPQQLYDKAKNLWSHICQHTTSFSKCLDHTEPPIVNYLASKLLLETEHKHFQENLHLLPIAENIIAQYEQEGEES